jgi:hypothetical protein
MAMQWGTACQLISQLLRIMARCGKGLLMFLDLFFYQKCIAAKG